ncbi:MAG: PadR family transcriptional regulator [Candidatus Heimdallarchaeaceae archaeon]
MSKTKNDAVSKFEEKLARRLGEIAILLHLARHPEGDHAYEIRTKASDILFKHKRKSIDFVNDLLEVTKELFTFATGVNIGTSEYDDRKKKLEESLEKYPIFKFNPHFIRILTKDSTADIGADLKYLEEITKSLEETREEVNISSTIWSNISGIYPAIDSLVKNGLIQLLREDIEGGRLKKIYGITELGTKALNSSILSLIDITSFIFHIEMHSVIGKEDKTKFEVINPFRDLFRKLAHEIPPENRKKLIIKRGKHHKGPFSRMIVQHGLSIPNPRFLIQKPEIIPHFLNQIENEDEKNITIDFLKKQLKEHRDMINKALEKLK